MGGTKLGVALVLSDGEILQHHQMATKREYALVVEDIVTMCRAILDTSSIKIEGVGLGIAGQVDASDGKVLFVPNLNWRDVPLQSDLQKALRLPVHVLNDVRAATWGEWKYGAGRGCNDLLCLFIGTGLGGGLVSEGRLLSGATNTAGELGHTTLVWNGRLCSCGHRGCLEAYVSGWGIAKTLREAVQRKPQSSKKLLDLAQGNIENLKGEHLAAAYAAEDPLATRLVAEVADALGAGCVSFINAFNPSRLIFGGGVIAGFPILIPLVSKNILATALPAATGSLEVAASTLEASAPIIGAAAAILQGLRP